MRRREFLQLTAGIAGAAMIPSFSFADGAQARPETIFDDYFLTVLKGFLKNAKATSPTFTVCDFPNGTKLKTCCTPSGKTYTSIARMLLPMVEWVRAGRESKIDLEDQTIDLKDVLRLIYTTAFDPKHPDYWD